MRERKRTAVIAAHRQRLKTPGLVAFEADLADEATNTLEAWLRSVLPDSRTGKGEIGILHVRLSEFRAAGRCRFVCWSDVEG